MKFKIYGEKINEPEVFLRLIRNDGDVDLVVCNDMGSPKGRGTILSIASTGELILCGNLSQQLGLDVDSAGYVRVRKN